MIDNKEGNEHCPYCDNTGWVEVTAADVVDEEWLATVRHMRPEEQRVKGLNRAYYGEEMGPCPKCGVGQNREFPTLKAGEPLSRLPWGMAGYWQGRDHSWLEAKPQASPVFDHEYNKQMLAWLNRRLTGVVEPQPDPPARLRVVEAEPLATAVALVESEELGRCQTCGKADQAVAQVELSRGRVALVCRECRGA